MTDPTVPPEEPDQVHADLELASAHLDDEVTSEERARVESDAELRDHVDSLAAVVDRVRDVPGPPAGLLDAHVAVALSELDAAAGEGGDVVSLPGHGARRWWHQVPLGAVAAAVVVVALLGVVGLASLSSEDGDDTAADATTEQDDSGGEDFSESGEALVPEASTTFDADAADEGADGSAAPMAGRSEFASYDDLVAHLDQELAAADRGDAATSDGATSDDAAPDEETTSDGTDPCDAVSLLDLDPGDVVTVLAAFVGGDAVTAVVHAADDGRRVVVVDDATCQVVRDQAL